MKNDVRYKVNLNLGSNLTFFDFASCVTLGKSSDLSIPISSSVKEARRLVLLFG